MITNQDLQFYKENGYLIIQNFLTSQKIDELSFKYDELRIKLADSAGIKFADYQAEISQVRDIWRFDDTFKKLILIEEIAITAPLFFEDNSCRLLHDHIINKPIGNNGIVPWHQDYTYWPIDNPNGLSFWLPFSDLDENAGVLEVVAKSHLWGEEAPVDFINDQKDFSTDDVRYLTVRKGDLVVLNALSWHRTSENTSVKERKAYISLWISSNSTYAPKHASWHPVNDNVSVNDNEELNEDWFPIIGSKGNPAQNHKYLDNSSTENMRTITMYNASKIAKKFFQKHLDLENDVWRHLYNEESRRKAVQLLLEKFNFSETIKNDLDKILLSMSVNGLAYQNHRARNVYNKSYVRFKEIFQDNLVEK
jgi:ectoine hydroxylase-related dioxygenase (phytanoyl-CoA dioxygenase family)